MVEAVPSVSIPAFPYYCDLVVFPSPYKHIAESSFFLLKKTADVPTEITGNLFVEFIPGSVYCFLPSCEKSKGTVSVHESRPSFLDDYSYCLEISKKSIDFLSSESESIGKLNNSERAVEERNLKPCLGCFVYHFPRPNTFLCKWNKDLKNCKNGCIKPWTVRLSGGSKTDIENPIVEKAVSNAKAHGINLHAGVKNLANGNCAFESIIDSINTRPSFEESFDKTPDFWRHVWMTEVKNVGYENWNNGLTRAQWDEGWEVLKQSRAYECQLGDLVLPGIAHCVQKTSSSLIHPLGHILLFMLLKQVSSVVSLPTMKFLFAWLMTKYTMKPWCLTQMKTLSRPLH